MWFVLLTPKANFINLEKNLVDVPLHT
jgi:hypothetical protein